MNKEEIILRNRLEELAEKAYQQNIYTYTYFLNEYEQDIFHRSKSLFHYGGFNLYGGHPLSTRSIAVFGDANAFGYDPIVPIDCIAIKPVNRKFADMLTHRDFLGALIHLGISRELIGDIIVENSMAYLFCMNHITPLITNELIRVKHTDVFCEVVEDTTINISPHFKNITGFVSSCRLDTLIGLAFKLSRSQSIPYIQGNKVFVNGRLTLSNSIIVKEQDIISVRGLGKFMFAKSEGISKKGRQHILIKLFI